MDTSPLCRRCGDSFRPSAVGAGGRTLCPACRADRNTGPILEARRALERARGDLADVERSRHEIARLRHPNAVELGRRFYDALVGDAEELEARRAIAVAELALVELGEAP